MVSAKDNDMLSINNGYDYTARERTVLELYKQGKSTRDIAKELRMSLRDISIILRNSQLSRGIAISKDNRSDNNNKSSDQKATQAYKLFSKGTKLSDVAIELGLREKERLAVDDDIVILLNFFQSCWMTVC